MIRGVAIGVKAQIIARRRAWNTVGPWPLHGKVIPNSRRPTLPLSLTTHNGGYSRYVQRTDGNGYCFATAKEHEPHIEATIWAPDSLPEK